MSQLQGLALIALGLLVGCGGGAGAAPGAKTKAEQGASETSAEGADEESEAATDPLATACADDTCVRCGKGICPSGFYCDESAPGGASCGWLPECASKPSCSCVTQGLGSGCGCEERAGGLFVSCK